MSDRLPIQALSDQVINRIAAGEVVERPASIVKELVENSLDAGARRVTVELNGGGIERILVRDDGHGIPAEQLKLALSRHCTSKLVEAVELEKIASLGFRGEALASIAAVAELTIISRTDADDHGWRVDKHAGSELKRPRPEAHPHGTTIEVRDLFAAIPVRRRFLKQPRTELLQIQQLIRRAGFCYPEITFTLSHDERPSLSLLAPRQASSAQRRWQSVFGREFVDAATTIDVEVDGLRLEGWVGELSYSRQGADLQYLAVNRRIVRDRHIAHAARMAYGDAVPDGRYPAYALRLVLPGTAVDVNVHPGKAEVRFVDPRTVHDIVYASVKQALLAPNNSVGQSQLQYLESLASEPRQMVADGGPRDPPWRSAMQVRPGAPSAPPLDRNMNFLAVAENRFALSNGGQGVAVMDLQQSIPFIVSKRLERGECNCRPLIIPEAFPSTLGDDDMTALLACGVEFGRLSARTVALRAMPVIVSEVDPQRFGAHVLEQLAAGASYLEAVASGAGVAFQTPSGIGDCRRWFANLTQQLDEFGGFAEAFSAPLTAAELARLFESKKR